MWVYINRITRFITWSKIQIQFGVINILLASYWILIVYKIKLRLHKGEEILPKENPGIGISVGGKGWGKLKYNLNGLAQKWELDWLKLGVGQCV